MQSADKKKIYFLDVFSDIFHNNKIVTQEMLKNLFSPDYIFNIELYITK